MQGYFANMTRAVRFPCSQGRSRSEAFQLGEEMAAVVTADNPDPVKLKFEKVYQPCILQVGVGVRSSLVAAALGSAG